MGLALIPVSRFIFCSGEVSTIHWSFGHGLNTKLVYSPVWLTRQGRAADAEAALRRLAVPGLDVLPDLERMVELDRQEQSFEASSSYTDIFKGTNLRRTMISTISYASIATTGNNLANNTAYFMLRMFLPLRAREP